MEYFYDDFVCDLLDVSDVRSCVQLAATCKRFRWILQLWLTKNGLGTCKKCYNWRKYGTILPATRDWSFVDDLRVASTCPCGEIGWGKHSECSCWVWCYFCERKLPQSLCSMEIIEEEPLWREFYCSLSCCIR